jgi:glycine/sarcosine N-methyltransferase
MPLSIQEFYDRLADEYHLIFGNWDEAVKWQGEVLDTLLRSETGRGSLSILDCSCGIGTQAIGLALLGHRLTATDLSPRSIERAREEAQRFGVEITFGTADFRALEAAVEGTFDAVISLDNALAHMMSWDDLLSAARSIRSKVREGGLFMASIRDYDELLKERPDATRPKVINTPEGRRVYFQVWDWDEDGRAYLFNLFLLREEGEGWQTVHYDARYRAVLGDELCDVLKEAGLSDIGWKRPAESGYYQPIVTARV